MVVVVAIIALIVGLSFPSATAGLENVRIVSASDSVAAFLNSAVNRAERRQQPVQIVVFPQEGRLALYSGEPGFTRQLTMPEGVTIEAVLPAEEGADPAAPRRILFLPGATVPGISIQLGNRRHAHRRIHLDPMTGFPRVESVVIP
jgi:type II secretory pathway pseudopilin PulG